MLSIFASLRTCIAYIVAGFFVPAGFSSAFCSFKCASVSSRDTDDSLNISCNPPSPDSNQPIDCNSPWLSSSWSANAKSTPIADTEDRAHNSASRLMPSSFFKLSISLPAIKCFSAIGQNLADWKAWKSNGRFLTLVAHLRTSWAWLFISVSFGQNLPVV